MNWTRLLPAALLGAALAANAAAEPVTNLTLADCLRIGLTRGYSLANARRDEAIAAEESRQIRAQAYPALAAAGRYTWLDDPAAVPGAESTSENETYHAALTAQQLLYSGGAVRSALQAARHFRDRAGAAAAGVERALLRDISLQYYAVLYAAAAAQVADASFQQLEDFAQQTARKHAQGMASEFDWLTAQVRVANERPLRDAAHNRLALARSTLRNLVNLETGDFTLADRLTAPTNHLAPETAFALALVQRPELAAAGAQIGFFAARQRVERSAFLPELRAFASYTGDRPNQYDPTSDEWQWGWQAGGTLTWSILDGGLRSGRVAAVNLERDKAEAARDELRQQIRLEIEQAGLNLQNARDTLRGTAEGVRLAERALAIARTRVDQGLATYLELTDSNVALSRARLAQIGALTACRQAWIELQFAAGGDVAEAATMEGVIDE